jgi:hypothetical protein
VIRLGREPRVRSDADLSREAALLGANGFVEVQELLRRGELPAAGAFLEAALARWPAHTGLQAEMGRWLLASGAEPQGLEWLERSCGGWPRIAECAFYRALYHERRGEVDRAAADAREALRRDPGHAPSRSLLARLERAP